MALSGHHALRRCLLSGAKLPNLVHLLIVRLCAHNANCETAGRAQTIRWFMDREFRNVFPPRL
jgi:hypothetical protein